MTKALENHSVTYLQSLPSSHQHINAEIINKQISQFRVYNKLNDRTLIKLNSCFLVAESEQNLKYAVDYKAVLDLELKCCAPLMQYLEMFVMPSPGDWPTWYFVKKIIAHSDNTSPLNSIIPEQGAFHVILNATEDAVVLLN
ncbi:Hypothetical predicted protein [Paramuricea clavata]|uniref:Uncharacterized protein n=1 Tax=Paramuricea clavata TaxID=317549 RepID=A0A7D9E7Y9_PARCT|nr:Hypothetical predicted protein [Paramuricea clavata]